MSPSRLLALCAWLLLTAPLAAQDAAALQTAVDAFAADEALRHGQASICIADARTGELLASYGPEKALVPASSLKLFTTATALVVLGSEYRFRTEVQYDGRIGPDGVLEGNLYLKGYGDPTLGSPDMDGTPRLDELLAGFVAAVRGAGIRSVRGKVIGDASYFEPALSAPTWQWDDIGNYYGAGPSGLNLHDNLYYLDFQQSKTLGAKAEIAGLRPSVPNLLLINEVLQAEKGTGDQVYIFGAPYNFSRVLRGSIPVGKGIFTVKGSLPDPALFAAQQWLMALEAAGIGTSGEASTLLELERRGQMPQGARQNLHTHYSPPLRDIVRRINEESVNLYCEVLLKAMSRQRGGNGTLAHGLQIVEETWQQRGLDTEGFFIEDGSGLSPRNGVSSQHFVRLLGLVDSDRGIADSFYQSLAIAGQSGTFKGLLKGTAGAGKVRGKSGTLRRVRSYTGYVDSRSGRRLAFCIIANNFTGSSGDMRKKMEGLMLAMVGW